VDRLWAQNKSICLTWSDWQVPFSQSRLGVLRPNQRSNQALSILQSLPFGLKLQSCWNSYSGRCNWLLEVLNWRCNKTSSNGKRLVKRWNFYRLMNSVGLNIERKDWSIWLILELGRVCWRTLEFSLAYRLFEWSPNKYDLTVLKSLNILLWLGFRSSASRSLLTRNTCRRSKNRRFFYW